MHFQNVVSEYNDLRCPSVENFNDTNKGILGCLIKRVYQSASALDSKALFYFIFVG